MPSPSSPAERHPWPPDPPSVPLRAAACSPGPSPEPGSSASDSPPRGPPARIESLKKSDPVRSVAAAYVSDSERAALSSAAARDLPPRSRVLPGTGTRAAAERERDFLAVAVPWLAKVPERLVDLAVSALLDLWILSDDLPGPVASWSGAWRYIWPRDTAFVAAALAAVGHAELAWGQAAPPPGPPG
ncbi:hypothetical protein IOD13_06070 [Brevibacterium casei]|nr:hypothetical protein [Brevibacterium casei]